MMWLKMLLSLMVGFVFVFFWPALSLSAPLIPPFLLSLPLVMTIGAFCLLCILLLILIVYQRGLILAYKKAEEKQALLTSRLEGLFDAVPHILIIVNEEGRVQQINHKGESFTGKSRKAVLGELAGFVMDCLHASEKDGCGTTQHCADCPVRSRVVRLLKEDIPSHEEVGTLHLLKDGVIQKRHLLISTAVLDGDSCGSTAEKTEGEDQGQEVLISITDITDIKAKEEQLARQQRTIALTNRIANTFLTVPEEDLYTAVLQAILEPLDSSLGFLGYVEKDGSFFCPALISNAEPSPQVLAQGIHFAKEDLQGVLGQTLREKKSIIFNQGLDVPANHAALHCALLAPIIHQGDFIGQVAVANKRDGYTPFDQDLLESAARQIAPILANLLEEERQVKEKQDLEAQIRQAQKMESVGRLAGGVAHDLNNLLAPILGYGEMLVEDLSSGDPRKNFALEIVHAGKRAGDIIQQLLAFSRKQAIKLKEIDINILIRDFERLLRRTLREDIAIELDLDADLPCIQGDQGQLEQIIMNLAVNAQDAMPHGGTFSLHTGRMVKTDTNLLERPEMKSGPYVILSIRDTGTGMDSITASRIFEPFFTTKEKYRGTGLGLSMAYGIVKQHAGYIYVQSTPGKGTLFTLYLPVSTGMETSEEAELEPVAEPGRGTILLVEDNAEVLNIIQQMLIRGGYEVLAVGCGEEALHAVHNRGGKVHLLLTDVIMPRMDGKALSQAVTAAYPHIRVLFMSGYTNDVISSRGILDEGVLLLTKPFTRAQLLARVAQALEG